MKVHARIAWFASLLQLRLIYVIRDARSGFEVEAGHDEVGRLSTETWFAPYFERNGKLEELQIIMMDSRAVLVASDGPCAIAESWWSSQGSIGLCFADGG